MKTKVQAFGGIMDATVVSIPVNNDNTDFYLHRQSGSLTYQPRTRSQLATSTSLDRDEFARRMCVALLIFVQKDEGPSLSLAGPPGLVVFL